MLYEAVNIYLAEPALKFGTGIDVRIQPLNVFHKISNGLTNRNRDKFQYVEVQMSDLVALVPMTEGHEEPDRQP